MGAGSGVCLCRRVARPGAPTPPPTRPQVILPDDGVFLTGIVLRRPGIEDEALDGKGYG
jgi:hypothetical protein